MPAIRGASFAALSMLVLPATAYADPTVEKGETFGEWTVYADAATPHEFCFVTSEPKKSEPTSATRDAPRMYISAWPKDGVKSELSFRMGFPIKKATEGKATVAPATFTLFGSKDRAYVADATQELKLVEAMKKGSDLAVAVTSERGTVVTDTYSLAGLNSALQRVRDTCF